MSDFKGNVIDIGSIIMKMKKKYPSIYVEWCDSIEFNHEWLDINSAIEWCKRNDDWIIKQTSFLLKETDKYILLTSKINPQINGNIIVDGLQKIPNTWIKKRKILK